MELHIYFEFEVDERRPIALMVNGDNVGLQTASFNGKRVYTYNLRDYQNDVLNLIVKTLGESTSVQLTIINEKGKMLQKHIMYLNKNDNGSTLTIDRLRLDAKQEYITKLDSMRPIEVMPRTIRKEKFSHEVKIANREFERKKAHFDYQVARKDLLTAKADEPQNTIVEVFYATDRARKKSKRKERITYTNSRGDLEFGKCLVNVPGNREKGELPLPPWYLFGLFSDENQHMVIKDISQLDSDSFLNEIKNKVNESPETDALLFIHGYNVGFTESVMRTAQMTADIGFRGAPIVYSWPSRKSIMKYFADEATATGYSVDSIIELIKNIRMKTGAKRVHLIAHSMGNRLLTDALKSLNDQGFTKQFQFNQVILAAPDIDAEVFVKHIAPKIVNSGKQVTLYTSVHDLALWVSGGIHGVQRAGKSGERLAVVEGIDTVDASKESTDILGHGYFAQSKALIQDIFSTIRHGHSPENRNLRMRESGERIYWDFS